MNWTGQPIALSISYVSMSLVVLYLQIRTVAEK